MKLYFRPHQFYFFHYLEQVEQRVKIFMWRIICSLQSRKNLHQKSSSIGAFDLLKTGMMQRKFFTTKCITYNHRISSRSSQLISLGLQRRQSKLLCYQLIFHKNFSSTRKIGQSFIRYSTNLNPKVSVIAIPFRFSHAIYSPIEKFNSRSRSIINQYLTKKNKINIEYQRQARFFCAHRSQFKTKSQAKFVEELREKNFRLAAYGLSIVIAVIGISYASVPLYKVFCQATGFGGTTKRVESLEKLMEYQRAEGNEKNEEGTSTTNSKWKRKDGSDEKIKKRMITVTFNADVSDTLPWKFWPTQKEVAVIPGETALAFFTVKNKTEKAITGIATYNVTPLKAGEYFNKIQCFCFDEQRVKAKEQIDMPVFFFLDPELLADPSMDNVHDITLSYTFFNTGEEEVEEQFEKAKAEGTLPLHHKAR